MTHSISTNPQKPRYAVCGPVAAPSGETLLWLVVDTQASKSKIVEYVQGKDEAVARAKELNANDRA